MVTMQTKVFKVTLLMLLTMGFVFGCLPLGLAAETASPEQLAAVQEIIAAWDAKYSAEEIAPEQWQKEEELQAYVAVDAGRSLEELIPKLDALQTALLAIVTDEAYASISPEYLSTFLPYIGFYMQDGTTPSWYFNLLSPDVTKDNNDFTIFVDAKTGEILSLVHASGNG